jgi:hypothetical protein
MKPIVFSLIVLLATPTTQAQTQDEVGDLDSFGRDVIHLGLASTGSHALAENCDLVAEGVPCQLLPAQPNTHEFSHLDLDSIRLPARASNSLLCFAMTPQLGWRFENKSANNFFSASLTARAVITIQSSVLNNPALINPLTGLPFNGSFDVTLPMHLESRRMAVGDFAQHATTLTRSCQGALISKRQLVDLYGLTQAQANSFFNNVITVRLGMNGSARLVTNLTYGYGLRLYGDRR